jgi:hypothetical protein
MDHRRFNWPHERPRPSPPATKDRPFGKVAFESACRLRSEGTESGTAVY